MCRTGNGPTVGQFARPGGLTLPGVTLEGDKFVVDKKVETAFLRKFSYFQAIFKTCKECGATWLSVYYEDLTNTDPMKEFGDRYGYERIVTDEEIAYIRKKFGMGALDVDDFAPGK